MKRVSFLITIVLLSTTIAKAQHPDHPNFDPKEVATRTIDELSQQISISSAIQDSLKATFIHFFDEMKKERESGNHPDMEKVESKRDLKVKSFLTDSQFKVYLEFIGERRLRRGRPSGDRRLEQPNGMQ